MSAAMFALLDPEGRLEEGFDNSSLKSLDGDVHGSFPNLRELFVFVLNCPEVVIHVRDLGLGVSVQKTVCDAKIFKRFSTSSITHFEKFKFEQIDASLFC